MYYSTIHVHTDYCDGNDKAEDMILAAIANNMKTIGISSHGPLPFSAKWAVNDNQLDNYINEINSFKVKYSGKIDVLLGMEYDYFIDTEFSHIDNNLTKKLDYFIGSIHYINRDENGNPWTIDGKFNDVMENIKKTYNNDMKHVVRDYYENIAKMVYKYRPDVVGHIDLIKKNNKNNILFNENDLWYKNIVFECLNLISKTDSVVEINTGAMARGFDIGQYPSVWILEKSRDLNIPITINSDAHNKDSIAFKFDEMYKLVKDLNLTNLVYLTSDGWKHMSI